MVFIMKHKKTPKSYQAVVRFTEKDYDRISVRAEEYGMTVAGFIRHLVLIELNRGNKLST